MKALPLFISAMVISTAACIQSTSASPEDSQITPISWILDSQHNIDVDEKYVTIVGQVIKRDNGSDWWFSDHTGSVRLDTDDKELPVGRMLIVRGNIDQSRFGIGHLEIEVKDWDYAPSTAR